MSNDVYISTKDTGFDYQLRPRLNRMGREVFDFFVRYFQPHKRKTRYPRCWRRRLSYAADIEQIIITSQDRGRRYTPERERG
jgi:hypothetical protein